MLRNADMLLSVVHEAEVRQATAYSEHRFEARIQAAKKVQNESADGWKVWKRLGSSRVTRKSA